ncbi:hypothetical protein TrVFT333_001767 [Trichoderma virens FT-333]|nr:hypothetical protein TrVFT333_001767 [Trichoderma virens FT-333]
MTSVDSKVYRLRGIPEHLDRLGVALLLSRFIPDGDQRDVNVASLALSCEIWARTRTKTATLSFKKLPDVVSRDPAAGEWLLRDLTWEKPLLLDDSFFGLSPLNDVPEYEHHYDCIVMSGLASHPIGSWQPHGKDKSFMWIRDALPHLVPNVKFILYGYDTKLAGSKSFQTVPDIALTFIHTLQQGGWAAPGSRKLVFFAHSLGGIILKEAFRMLADSSIMLQGQPNKDSLVKEISNESRFIETLEEQFSGISHLQKMKLLWAYETETTPTVMTVDGKYQRSGPGTVFVSPLSATSQRCNFDSGSTIQINANHSDMVKFSAGSELIDRIAFKLQAMLKIHVEKGDKEASGPAVTKTTVFQSNIQPTDAVVDHVDPTVDPEFWDIRSVIQAIHSPERDSRLEQIDEAAGHSFVWAFEKSSVGLTSWLQNDEKLFWISGKPASGKSTFMKYLHNNPLTADYLRIWHRGANFVRATFFFHHRGTAIQKSLEGLHRGILSQVLRQAPQSFLAMQPQLTQAYQAAIHANNLGSLSHDLETLIKYYNVNLDAEILTQFHKVLRCEMPLKAFRTMVLQPMVSMGATDDEDLIHQVYLRQTNLMTAHNVDKFNMSIKIPTVESILSEIETQWATNEEFISLVKGWLEAMEISTQLSILEDLLMARRLNESYKAQNTKVQPEDMIKELLVRFLARERQRHRVETGSWSLQQLSHAITLVTDQQLIDLNLCLFIDALDEHDGPPEFIAQFIKDIASTERTRTRLKILFSSRPWQPFIDAFGHSPGIQIHEFTENDIRELCLHTIRPDKPGSAEIIQLVEEIVKQARGVFLWARLVLNDLVENAARLTASGQNTVDLHATLIDVLKSLPTDLEQYYRTIIERIPYSYRWEAFCLLEAVSKSTERIYLREISDVLICANAQSIKDIYSQRSRRRKGDAGRYTKEHLRAHTGGLVETIDKNHQLQLLHQTLAEFVQLPEFKCIVLGERYRIVKENGYTILSKYEAMRHAFYSDGGIRVPVNETLVHYGREAESTTGNSMYFSFRGIIWTGIGENNVLPKYLKLASFTTLEVALACSLKLLLQDTLKHDKETRTTFIFPILAHMIEQEVLDIGGAIDVLRDMVAQGLQVYSSHFSLLILMDRLHHTTSWTNTFINFVQRAMTAFFEPGANIEVNMSTASIAITSSHFDELMLSHRRGGTIQALHIPTHYRITEHLLGRGADPNGMTSRNMTPLDCWVRRTQNYVAYHRERAVASALIRRGGRLNVSTRQEWEMSLQATMHPSFKMSPGYYELSFPGWLEGAPGAEIDGSQAVNPERLDVVDTQTSSLRQSTVRKWLRNSLASRKGK